MVKLRDRLMPKRKLEVSSKSVKSLRNAISRLPEDKPRDVAGVWYKTQKEHWLGWLDEYASGGAYGRKGRNYDARFAYNHIVEVRMLDWLAGAAGVSPALLRRARSARKAVADLTLARQSAEFRKVIPWAVIDEALWGGKPKAPGK